jgi:hypothetical protein
VLRLKRSKSISIAIVGMAAVIATGCSSSTATQSTGTSAPKAPAQPVFAGSGLLPFSVGQADGVSCSSVTDCVVVGDGIVYTRDGGVSWSTGVLPSEVNGGIHLAAISCPSTTDCVTGGDGPNGSAILYSGDGGATWSTGSFPYGPGLGGVSCSSVNNCVGIGVGTVIVSSDGGASWTQTTAASVPSGPNALSCSSESNCVAVAGYDPNSGTSGAAVTSDGGRSWVPGTVAKGVHGLARVSCASISDCIAVGENGITSCTSSNGCVPLGSATGTIESTSDGGNNWTLIAAPKSVQQLNDVACPSITTCVAVGTGGASMGALWLYSRNAGASWAVGALSGGHGLAANALESVSCPTSRTCVAVGGGGSSPGSGSTLAFTSDGGSSWQFLARFPGG